MNLDHCCVQRQGPVGTMRRIDADDQLRSIKIGEGERKGVIVVYRCTCRPIGLDWGIPRWASAGVCPWTTITLLHLCVPAPPSPLS